MLMNRLDSQRKFFMPEDAEAPSVTVRRFWFDTVSHAYPPALRLACTSYTVEKMVLGSDYPYEVNELYQRCVDYVADPGVGLTSDEVEMILDRNAQALFHLNP
jgi:aminocarboxymuconate-semialdehyde decarboxylase